MRLENTFLNLLVCIVLKYDFLIYNVYILYTEQFSVKSYLNIYEMLKCSYLLNYN